MNIEGTYTLQAEPEEIRRSLTDQEVLRRTFPGLEQLEQVSKNRYNIAIHIKHAPLLGTYRGQVFIQEDQQPNHYRLIIEGDGSATDTINGIGTVQFHELDANTTIFYKGTISIGKRGIRLSPKVTKGAAKLLIQQFLASLADQLSMDKTPITEDLVGAEVIKKAEGNIVILSRVQEDSTRAPAIVQQVVQTLRLGAGDPALEEVWIKRIRRIGFVSFFLFLVWIGTRLPRKKE